MKFKMPFIAISVMILALLAGFSKTATAYGSGWGWGCGGKIVIADRASGTISVISTKTDQVTGTYNLPAGVATPEPMYVVYSPFKHRVFVGDRANNRVVVFKAKDFSVETTVDAGAGVFHMWGDAKNRQLWVNNDIDNTSTVIDLITLDHLATVPTPPDLVALGGKPHDVIIDPKKNFAYVSIIGVSGDNDYVVKYCTKTFMETGRAAVGKDPHLSLNRFSCKLYVPCQNSDTVYILDRKTMDTVKELSVPGAHGVGMSRNGLFLYTSNLPNGGTDALYTIFTLFDVVIGDPVDTPFAVPHNLALTPNGRKIYVTHSGATSDKVTVFKTKGFFDPIPVYSTDVTVGLNPFGLAYVP